MDYFTQEDWIRIESKAVCKVTLQEYIAGTGYFVMVMYWTTSGKIISKSWKFNCCEYWKAQCFYYKALSVAYANILGEKCVQ
jgi:hypothetical protein